MTAVSEKENLLPTFSGEDDIQVFLRDIREFPLLTAEQERALAARCKQGDEEAIRQMVNSNLRLVVAVARAYAGRGVPLLDLIQEGCIGLLAAARKFDYTLDYRFSTYATKWIRRGVLRCLLNHRSMIRVPELTGEKIQKLTAARNAYRQREGCEPTTGELASLCGMTEAKVEELMQLNPVICSLDVPAGEEENDSLGRLLADLETPQPQEELVRQELEETLNTLLDVLDERKRRILRLHFGMEDGKCHSLEEIGKLVGVSKERVRQLECQAIDKLRELGQDYGLEDFLNE